MTSPRPPSQYLASRDFGMGFFPSGTCCLLGRMACSPRPGSSHMDGCNGSDSLSGCFSPAQIPIEMELPVCSPAQMGERVSLKALAIIQRMNGHLLWAGRFWKEEDLRPGVLTPVG